MPQQFDSVSTSQRNTAAADAAYVLLSAAVFLVLFTIARVLLLWRNRDLLGGIPLGDVLTAFGI